MRINPKKRGDIYISSVQSLGRVRLLWPHELQHARPPCPSPTPGVHSNSCPSSQWCHPAISSSVVPFCSYPKSLPASVFSNESTLCMRWPKYWSFSVSIIPSKEYPGLMDVAKSWLVYGVAKSWTRLSNFHSFKGTFLRRWHLRWNIKAAKEPDMERSIPGWWNSIYEGPRAGNGRYTEESKSKASVDGDGMRWAFSGRVS